MLLLSQVLERIHCIIFPIYNNCTSMSIEQKSQPQPINQDLYQQLKFHAQQTTMCSKSLRITVPSHFDFESLCSTSTDISFDQGIYQQNINKIKTASIEYISECLINEFDKNKGFLDQSIYSIVPCDITNEREIQGLINGNQLLSHGEKQDIVSILKREQDLIGLLKLVVPSFGLTVGKEIVFAMYQILSSKLMSFSNIIESKDTIIPKFNCFQGFEDNFALLQTSCPVYEQNNLEQVISFAQRDIESISSSLYFSAKIQYINLRQVKSDTKPKINVLNKFSNFIKYISRIVFLTIMGATEPMSGCCLELSRQVSFAEGTDSMLSIRRMSSRPFVPCQQQNFDFLSKKLKFDQSLQ